MIRKGNPPTLEFGYLSRIGVILLEWHHPHILSEIRLKVQKLGFHLLLLCRGEKYFGMLYAFRR
jgi:hypothetical protein